MIILLVFLLILTIIAGIFHYLYSNGYIPYTNPFKEKQKEKVDQIVNEISTKVPNEFRIDIAFIINKRNELEQIINYFSPDIKSYIIDNYYDILGLHISRILNHHVANVQLSNICNSNPIPDNHPVAKNSYNINLIFGEPELFNSCFYITEDTPTDTSIGSNTQIECYNRFKENNLTANICSIERSQLIRSVSPSS
jgi:hypothetical protein